MRAEVIFFCTRAAVGEVVDVVCSVHDEASSDAEGHFLVFGGDFTSPSSMYASSSFCASVLSSAAVMFWAKADVMQAHRHALKSSMFFFIRVFDVLLVNDLIS